jgi:hypothetical protein
VKRSETRRGAANERRVALCSTRPTLTTPGAGDKKMNMKDAFLTLAEHLQYDKISRLRQELDHHDDQTILAIIQGAMFNTHSIFMFPGKFFEFSLFGTNLHYYHSVGIAKTDNYIIAFPDLTETFLRKLFTGTELLLYKLSHIVIEKQRRGYHFETEKSRTRFKKLQDIFNVHDWKEYKIMFDELMFVRDAFAHSFIDLAKIEYYKVPLQHCFGYTYLGRTDVRVAHGVSHIFTDDLRSFFDPISRCFEAHQLEQDSRRLNR